MGMKFPANNKFKDAWEAMTISEDNLPRYLRTVHEVDFAEFCGEVQNQNDKFVDSMTSDLFAGDAFILRGAYSKEFMAEVINKTFALCQKTPSSFYKMLEGCPNFHRKIDKSLADKYSFYSVKHSTYFYPWNDDSLNLFEPVWQRWGAIKVLSGQKYDEFTHNTPRDGVIDRIQVVHYPSGEGTLGLHSDPYLYQKLIISGFMSKKGVDFETGGFYMIGIDGEVVDLENQVEVGDMLIAYATVQHGVDVVDEHKPVDWDSIDGRWFLSMYSNVTDEVKDRHTGYNIKQ